MAVHRSHRRFQVFEPRPGGIKEGPHHRPCGSFWAPSDFWAVRSSVFLVLEPGAAWHSPSTRLPCFSPGGCHADGPSPPSPLHALLASLLLRASWASEAPGGPPSATGCSRRCCATSTLSPWPGDVAPRRGHPVSGHSGQLFLELEFSLKSAISSDTFVGGVVRLSFSVSSSPLSLATLNIF